MKQLKGYQKKYLRGLAHRLKPYVFIGQKGLTDSLLKSVSEALEKHELVKIKFLDFKETDTKKELTAEIEKITKCELVGIIGHMAIFYKQHKNPENRLLILPEKKKDSEEPKV